VNPAHFNEAINIRIDRWSTALRDGLKAVPYER
jgi:hypothetical protein